jgi:hypothetical protein
MPFKDKETRRKYGVQYQKTHRAQAKANRTCTRCGVQDDRTLSGRVECAVCARKRALIRLEKLWEEK